jgi:hypothetical protein
MNVDPSSQVEALMVRRFIHLRSHIFKGLWSTYRTSDLKAPTYEYRDASSRSGLYGPTSPVGRAFTVRHPPWVGP